jgi:hypothetical protein
MEPAVDFAVHAPVVRGPARRTPQSSPAQDRAVDSLVMSSSTIATTGSSNRPIVGNRNEPSAASPAAPDRSLRHGSSRIGRRSGREAGAPGRPGSRRGTPRSRAASAGPAETPDTSEPPWERERARARAGPPPPRRRAPSGVPDLLIVDEPREQPPEDHSERHDHERGPEQTLPQRPRHGCGRRVLHETLKRILTRWRWSSIATVARALRVLEATVAAARSRSVWEVRHVPAGRFGAHRACGCSVGALGTWAEP